MTKQELIDHLIAYSQEYAKDATAWTADSDDLLAMFATGKSEAFATAASWLSDLKEV